MRMKHSEHYKYVWRPYVELYHRCGWQLADADAIYSGPRGEHHTFLMEWPCDCPLRLPSNKSEHSNAK